MAQVATVTAGRARRLITPDRRARGAYWQHVVLSKITQVRRDLGRARAGDPGDDHAAEWQDVDDLLAEAQRAAHCPGWRVLQAITGSQVNRAFVNLHAAQVMLAEHVADADLDTRLLSAMIRVRTTMPPDARRRQDLETRYAEAARNPGGAESPVVKRWLLQKALEWSYCATDAQYARLRSFRNILSGVSFAVLCFVIGLGIVGMVTPHSLGLCFSGTICPTGTSPAAHDAFIIELLGAAGGVLVAVLGISKMQGTSTPYGVPLGLALLKLPLGALTALLGLVLIHGQFVPGLTDLDSSGQILAYAIAFGVAQHAVTAMVDRRGQELLSGIPGKRSAAPPPSANARR
jgi:hypothetical protein